MISVSVVLYNTRLDDMLTVVRSSLAAMSEEDVLYLVDNSEVVNSKARELTKNYDNVTYVFNGANIGYGRAHNVAMRLAVKEGKQFHAIINPDISFEKNVLESLANVMRDEPNLGHIMPKIVYPDGSTQYLCKKLPAPSDLFFRRFSPFKEFNQSLNQAYELRLHDYESRMNDVPALSGCFMFLRLSTVEEVGFFDENLFMYMEDFDLTRRILAKSKNCYYPTVQVAHAYEKGSYSNLRLLRYHLKSAFYYFFKWGWFCDSERTKINNNFCQRNNIYN